MPLTISQSIKNFKWRVPAALSGSIFPLLDELEKYEQLIAKYCVDVENAINSHMNNRQKNLPDFIYIKNKEVELWNEEALYWHGALCGIHSGQIETISIPVSIGKEIPTPYKNRLTLKEKLKEVTSFRKDLQKDINLLINQVNEQIKLQLEEKWNKKYVELNSKKPSDALFLQQFSVPSVQQTMNNGQSSITPKNLEKEKNLKRAHTTASFSELSPSKKQKCDKKGKINGPFLFFPYPFIQHNFQKNNSDEFLIANEVEINNNPTSETKETNAVIARQSFHQGIEKSDYNNSSEDEYFELEIDEDADDGLEVSIIASGVVNSKDEHTSFHQGIEASDYNNSSEDEYFELEIDEDADDGLEISMIASGVVNSNDEHAALSDQQRVATTTNLRLFDAPNNLVDTSNFSSQQEQIGKTSCTSDSNENDIQEFLNCVESEAKELDNLIYDATKVRRTI